MNLPSPWLRLCIAVLFILGLSQFARGATLPAGFAETRVATGLSSPTTMAVAPDGRLFVSEQGGALRVIKNGALLAQPFLTVSVNSSGERGLLGVAFDPAFATNNFIYVYYTTSTTPIHNRVSRFTASAANADVAAAGTEVQILNLPTLSSATNHNGGAIHFGTDGKLYITVGDNANSANAQSLNTPLGKVLRLNADGSIPSDNPFVSQTTGINQAIWARGLRNPFTFAIDRTNGRIHVNDVGQDSWEEVNLGVAGSNYGWPQTEGNDPSGVAGVRYPIHTYQNAGSFCAITGAAFYRPTTTTFPAEYAGRFFFGDYCGGFIRMLSPPDYASAAGFATGISSLVDIKVHPDGSLYYLARGNGGEVFRVQYTANAAPSISAQPASATVSAGQSATFSVTASGTAPLTYQWQRNGVNIAGANARTYTFNTVPADNGATFRVVVSNDFGMVTSGAATLTVLTNAAPTATITAPTSGALYRGGQVINFAGTGSDPEDGNLPPSAFTWRVDFHHDTHTHPFVADTSGVAAGTFTIATRGETSANVFYRVYLTVRDSSGLTQTSFVDVRPRTSVVRLESNVASAQLTLDGAPITAPFEFTGVEGVIRTLGAVTPQTTGGASYDFVSWSDGLPVTHEISTPTDDTTYTALFQPAATSTVFSDNFETDRGWVAAGASTATRGRWQRGDPEPTNFNGTTLQLGNCDGSTNCLITGLAAGGAVGTNDVDDGLTAIQSQPIRLPAGANLTLRFRYYLAHNNNATNADYFRVRIAEVGGPPLIVFERRATTAVAGGAWTTQTVNISSFAGKNVRLRFDVADASTGSIIEAGVDNVTVTRE